MKPDPLREWIRRMHPLLCVCDHCKALYLGSVAKPIGSPIEEMLASAFSLLGVDSDPSWKVHRQWPVLGYVADFCIEIAGVSSSIVVECDGHDFHERTKEQAEHDRRRDRLMTQAGLTVLRFTGSEIFRNPFECAQQVQSIGVDMDVAAAMAREKGIG